MEKLLNDELMIQRAQSYLYYEQRRIKWLIGEAEKRNVLVPDEIARMREQLEVLDYLIGILNKA